MTRRPFRFGVASGSAPSREAWAENARKIEALGYSTLVTGDHMGFGLFAPGPALMAAADATTTLRLGTHVFANDFRNPVMLAHEAATLDLLSDGRLEFGVGTGWYLGDYTAAGIPLDAPAVRVTRLEEAVGLFKRLFGDEPVTFHGDHYHVEDLDLQPKSLQRPHPPIYVGGGGKRMLSLAGREATIVGVGNSATRGGQMDFARSSPEGTVQKIAWIKEAAGQRFEELELHALYNKVVVTDDRGRAAEEVLHWLEGFPSSIVTNVARSVEDVLAAPYLLVGSVEQILEDLQERRERFGISYITVSDQYVDDFSPVVARLAGT